MKSVYSVTLIILVAFCQTLSAESPQIRNIVFTGNEAFSSEELRGLMQMQIGDHYDEELLQQDFDRIVEFYKEHGFRFASVDDGPLFVKKFPEGIYLRVHVDEGKIGKITVTGNRRTREYVIIRELLFQVGSTYTWEDELESERILRRKSYLGSAEILATRDPKTKQVWIEVEVSDLWTFFPALDLPAFSNSTSGFLASLSDSNVLGYGDSAGLRYQMIREEGEETRSLISAEYTAARLFDSYWEFDGTYTQKQEGNSWRVTLQRPLYSLQTRWSADFTASESFDEIRWYEHGRKTDTFARSREAHSGRVIRSFGDRHHQTQVALWAVSQRSNFRQVESLAPSNANFQNRNMKMIGVSLGRRKVDFLRTRFLNKMGRVEDIGIGYGYGASVGHASPLYGSDRSETSVSLFLNSSQAYRDRLFLFADTSIATRFNTQQLDNSVFSATFRAIRKDLFHQTLAAQISTVLGFRLDGESQVILGGENGLRGYDTRQFSGEKMIRFNIESRMVFWEHSLFVVGSAIFVDAGYVWNGESFDFGNTKRSVGFGLRFGFPKLKGSRVYRLDLAFPLDHPERSFSFSPVFSYAIGHVF